MAILRIPDDNLVLTEEVRVKERLAAIGIGYETWRPAHALRDDSPADEVLAAYAEEIERIHAERFSSLSRTSCEGKRISS